MANQTGKTGRICTKCWGWAYGSKWMFSWVIFFSLGGRKIRFYPWENNFFLRQQKVSSLFRKRVDFFESVFIFSLNKNIVKSERRREFTGVHRSSRF